METYGRYQLLAKLATGGMAQVFLARQSGMEGFEKLVVLKRILPHLAENEEFVAMFLQEAKVAARLNHPNVAQIFDLGKVGDSFFIAMEYVHGEDVRRVVRQASRQGRSLPVPLACRIVVGACEGLEFAHQKTDDQGRPLGIVHRDISPQNLLVTFEGGVKLIDFGIAKAADSASHTRTGVLKGKYSYMSPEQAEGKRVDRRSDVFALGIVLYELVTRKRLFKRHSDLATVQAVMACEFEPPSAVNPEVDPELERIILRVLTKDRDERLGSAGELGEALEEYLLRSAQPGSTAHLKRFMRELYAERLRAEARLGRPWYEEELPAKATPSGQTLDFPPLAPPPPVPDDIGEPTKDSGSNKSALTPILPREKTTAPDIVLAQAPRRSAAAAGPPPLSPAVADGELSQVSRVARGLRGRSPLVAIALVVAAAAIAAALVVSKHRGASPSTPEAPSPAVTAAAPSAPAVGAVKLDSNPSGASILLDGHATGKTTPALLADLAPRAHELLLSLAGYEDLVRTIHVEAGHTTEISERLRALQKAAAPEPTNSAPPPPRERARVAAAEKTTLAVDTTPAVNVEIDGQPRGTSPVSVELAPGRHEVRFVDAASFLDLRQTVNLAAGETQHLSRTFTKVKVAVSVTPYATGYLSGGRKLGDSPGLVELYPGTYRITWSNPDLNAKWEDTLVVPEHGAPAAVIHQFAP